MTVRPKPSKSQFRISSQSLEKIMTTRKTLCKSSPRLWNDPRDDEEPIGIAQSSVRVLTVNHPILRTLDSFNAKLREFNQVHTQLIVSDLFQHSLTASRVVKKLCFSLSTVSHAIKLFGQFEEPDAFLCNTIMRSYVNFNDPSGALTFYYHHMLGKCIFPNHYTFPILVKACAELVSVKEGEKIHAWVVKRGFELHLFVRNALIHMYSVFGRIKDARKVFDLSTELDLVTLNSMIDGYVKCGEVGIARFIFDRMPEKDVFSWNSMMSGYVGIGDMEAAKELFEKMPCRDIVSWNCLIEGYSRVGNLEAACDTFDRLPFRNVISWNIVLALYVRLKDYNGCLIFFDSLIEGGNVQPNEATLVSVLTACAHLGRLDTGRWIHSYITSNNQIKADVLLSTALLTMYVKCGEMDLAKDVFDQMPDKSVVSWNSMIMGYGVHGQGEKALDMFLEMEKSGQRPNHATFVCILSACVHAGMVLEGWWCFDVMRRVYKIVPSLEHYGCMVDLLARAGLVKDSEVLIKKIPEAGPALWGALLSSCRTHSNFQLGEIVAKRLIELKPEDVGAYVLLSNTYAAQGRWGDVENVRKLMMEKGLNKVIGLSTVYFGDSGSESSHGISPHKRSMLHSMLTEMSALVKLSFEI